MTLWGRVLCLDGRFTPMIESESQVLWRGAECVDVWVARWTLTEAVALAGLCFWPPSYLNDLGRPLGVSPWAAPRCPRCGNEVDPTTCWCGSEIPHNGFDNHNAVPMGCECNRSVA